MPTTIATEDDRDVIPRWRSVRRTLAAGEFQRRPDATALETRQVAELASFEERWADVGGPTAASEFLGAAIVAGERQRAAATGGTLAGELLWMKAFPTAEDHTEAAGLPDLPDLTSVRLRIAIVKQRLARDPRDAIAWADVARHYTAIGQDVHAENALRIARKLAPGSRYLLRVMARFLVHVERPDEAHRMLVESDRTAHDPWLLSAALATASIAGRPVRELKRARRVASDDDFRPIERAELEAQLATLELRAGADKRALSGFRRGLESPTDNALAQAQWASSRLRQLEVSLDRADVPFASEAHALAAADNGNWSEALIHSGWWLEDQPLDSNAAMIGSYAASVGLADFETAIRFARIGLRARPRELSLQNNLAYALIQNGDLDEARSVLESLADVAEAGDDPSLVATRGLLAWRSGDYEAGLQGYRTAIDLAADLGDQRMQAMARTMLIGERLRLGAPSERAAFLASAEEIALAAKDPGISSVVHRLGSTWGNRSKPD